MTAPINLFRHCPACGRALPAPAQPNAVHCSACGFLYFLNTTVATGLILSRPDDAVLFVRRAREPAQGKLALPGGFIEPGETAEAGLQREVLEEVGLKIKTLTYLCSALNSYHYRSVTYPVLDLFFTARLDAGASPEALEDVAEICWLEPAKVAAEDIAFPSLRAALRRYLERPPPEGR
jgi:ADP-ribose pyrophosphatase YjhB (NUDIX family)